MTIPDDALLDEIYRWPPERRLGDCPPCEALPAQSDIIQRAVARARELGLKIPADLRIATVAVTHAGTQPAETEYEPRTGRIRVWVNVGTGVQPQALAQAVLHQMSHVDQAQMGVASDGAQLERRAVAFARQAMIDWGSW